MLVLSYCNRLNFCTIFQLSPYAPCLNVILFFPAISQSLITAHDQFKATLSEADKERMAIMGIHNEILKIAQTYGIKVVGENPYTVLSPQDISNKWEAVSTVQSLFYHFSLISKMAQCIVFFELGEVLPQLFTEECCFLPNNRWSNWSQCVTRYCRRKLPGSSPMRGWDASLLLRPISLDPGFRLRWRCFSVQLTHSSYMSHAMKKFQLLCLPLVQQEISHVSIDIASSLEEQMSNLKTYEQNIINYKSNIDKLEGDHQLSQEGLIFDNKHTSYTMEVLTISYFLFILKLISSIKFKCR